MKKFTLIAAAVLSTYASIGQATWTSDKNHAKLGFEITHMMVSDVDGSFNTFEAKISSAKPDFSDAAITMTADVNSINTDNEARDKHLKTPDFFDAAKYPTITFKSTSIKKVSDKKYKLTGSLTMHGVTKTITLDMIFKGATVNPMSKKDVAGFKITGTINRQDFGVGASTGNAMVSTDVQLVANGEFTKD